MEIIEDKQDFQVLVLIARGDNYVQRISEALNVAVPPALRRLQKLEKAKYLISERQKEFNRKIYAVNWKRITEAFIDNLSRRSADALIKLKELGLNRKDLENNLKPLLKKGVTDELKKDEEIRSAIRSLIKDIRDPEGYNLKYIFDFMMKSQLCKLEVNKKAKLVCA